MEVYAKVGTGPGRRIWIGWKRKPPKIGDFVKFKAHPPKKYERWETGFVDGIGAVQGQLLFFIARF